jgi:hypothetical protein
MSKLKIPKMRPHVVLLEHNHMLYTKHKQKKGVEMDNIVLEGSTQSCYMFHMFTVFEFYKPWVPWHNMQNFIPKNLKLTSYSLYVPLIKGSIKLKL